MRAKIIVLPLLMALCLVACAGTSQLRYAEIGVVGTYEVWTAIQRVVANAKLDGIITDEEFDEYVALSAKVETAHHAYRNAVALAQTVSDQESLADYLMKLQGNKAELRAAITAAIEFLVDIGVMEGSIEL